MQYVLLSFKLIIMNNKKVHFWVKMSSDAFAYGSGALIYLFKISQHSQNTSE